MTLLFGAIVPEDHWESLFEGGDVEQDMKMLDVRAVEEYIK